MGWSLQRIKRRIPDVSSGGSAQVLAQATISDTEAGTQSVTMPRPLWVGVSFKWKKGLKLAPKKPRATANKHGVSPWFFVSKSLSPAISHLILKLFQPDRD